MFPKLTNPLAKAVRTSEGVLVWLINAALAAGTIIEPSKLPTKEAAIAASALTAVHVVSRTLLKVVAVQQGVGLGEPESVDVPAEVKKLVVDAGLASDQRFAEIGKVLNEGMNSLNGTLAAHIREIAKALNQAGGTQPTETVAEAEGQAQPAGQGPAPGQVAHEAQPSV